MISVREVRSLLALNWVKKLINTLSCVTTEDSLQRKWGKKGQIPKQVRSSSRQPAQTIPGEHGRHVCRETTERTPFKFCDKYIFFIATESRKPFGKQHLDHGAEFIFNCSPSLRQAGTEPNRTNPRWGLANSCRVGWLKNCLFTYSLFPFCVFF